jgi:hypothetical protein
MRIYLISEISIDTLIDGGEDSKSSDIDSTMRILGLMNFFGIYILDSDFDIFEIFIYTLILGL